MSLDVLVRALEKGNPYHKPAGPGGGQFTGSGGGGVFAGMQITGGIELISDTLIEHWSKPKAKDMMVGIVASRGEKYILRDSDGKVQAGVSFDSNFGGVYYIAAIASNVRGGGTRLMARVCEDAASHNRGIMLFGLAEAQGFYRKIGMSFESDSDIFRFSAKRADSFAKKYARATK